jgi:hypothetical protein
MPGLFYWGAICQRYRTCGKAKRKGHLCTAVYRFDRFFNYVIHLQIVGTTYPLSMMLSVFIAYFIGCCHNQYV